MRDRFWRAIIIFLAFFISLILQTTILPLLQVWGIVPDLLLILIVFNALFSNYLVGGLIGFLVGFLQDLLTGRFLGLCAFSGLVAGWLVGEIEGKFFKENPLVPIILVFGATIVYDLVYFLGRGLCGSLPLSLSQMVWAILLEAVYNMVLAFLLYRPLFRVFSSKEKPYSGGMHIYDIFYG